MFGIEDFTQSIVDFENFEVSQLGDAALFGGAVLLMGVLVIFAVLTLIWLCLVLFRIFFHDLPAKRSKKEAAPVATAAVQEIAETASDDEIVAVIAAAIAMAESSSGGAKFKVVSFKRK